MIKKFSIFSFLFILNMVVFGQYPNVENELDKKIKSFLKGNADSWNDMNISISDGKILYDIIIQNKYKNALEIGTSTGHSAIWIAWALSKTGGKLTTIEIDKKRYLQAKSNFKKAGVEKYIDARLGDAHEIVPSVEGNYDFVFSDADKYWYKNYFIAMDPKITDGGCFTAHNVAMEGAGIKEFLEYIKSLKNYKTTIDNTSRSGMSVSYKSKAGNK